MTDLTYFDIRPVLTKIADLGRGFVLVGGQAVNFWASHYEARVTALAQEAPFASKDIDFCGDREAVRACAERLAGKALLPTLDDMTPSSGMVEFVDTAGVSRTLDVVAAPYGLDAAQVRDTALSVQILDDGGEPIGVSFYVMHPVLCLESRVHNVSGLAAIYDNDHGRKQLRAAIAFVREFLRDVVEGRMDVEDPARFVLDLNERIFRFCMRDLHAKDVHKTRGLDPADAILDHELLPDAFRTKRLPQMKADLRTRGRNVGTLC